MLSPRQSSTRERTSLDGLWRFVLDPRGAGRAEGWWTTGLPGDREMPVPASFNDVLPSREVRHHVGDVWYQRTVRVPRGWAGQARASSWTGSPSSTCRGRRPRPSRAARALHAPLEPTSSPSTPPWSIAR
jgi:hypothetical protein